MGDRSIQERLRELLGGAEAAAAAQGSEPGTFACSGPLTRVNPGLEVDGAGKVALPLEAAAVGALQAACTMAPFGSGEQTIVDPAVRHTWQADPELLEITNPRWEEEVVPEAVRLAKASLGILPDTEVETQPYKLLLYEPGSHFKPHRDTEKAPGMFATLCIMLPSAYEGGELVVRHDGREVRVDLAARNAKSTCWAAFYADCEHEVLPVTSGHRLCLIYNLCYTGRGPTPPSFPGEWVRRLVALAQEWGAEAEAPMKLCFVLSHKYSEESLQQRSVDALKTSDRAAVQLVLQACQQGAELEGVLAPLQREVTGEAGEEMEEYDFETDTYRERFYWGSLRIGTWSLLAGPTPAFSSLVVAPPQELVQEQEWWESQAADKVTSEYTGNEGSYTVKWYRSTCICLWPHCKRLLVTAASEMGYQILRLHNTLSAADQAQPPASMAAWEGVSTDKALERLKREFQPKSEAGGSKEADDEDMWWTGYGSDDEEYGAFVRGERRRHEEKEARLHWGPQPDATPQQLALAIAEAAGAVTHEKLARYDELVFAMQMICKLNDEAAAQGMLKAAAQATWARAGVDVHEALLRMVAHFGWPAAWAPLLGHVAKQQPLGRGWANRTPIPQTNVLQAAMCLADTLPSPDGGVSSRKCLSSLALGMAAAVHQHLFFKNNESLQRFGIIPEVPGGLVPPLKVLLEMPGAGSQLALEQLAETMLAWHARHPKPIDRYSYGYSGRSENPPTLLGVGCLGLLEAVGIETVAACPVYLKMLSRALADVAASVPPEPQGAAPSEGEAGIAAAVRRSEHQRAVARRSEHLQELRRLTDAWLRCMLALLPVGTGGADQA